MSTPIDKCHAAYLKCLGSKPTQLREIECTFEYAQCVNATVASLVKKALASGGNAKPARKAKAADAE